MISIIAFKSTKILNIASYFPYFKIYIWKKITGKSNAIKIEFPDSSLYFENRNKASLEIEQIIKKGKGDIVNKNSLFIYDYIGKDLLLNIDYFIFKKFVKKIVKKDNYNFFLENIHISNIVNSKKEFGFFIIFFYYFIKFCFFFLRSLFFTFKTSKIDHPHILFLRKKEYYDLGLFKNFKDRWNNNFLF